LIERNAEEKLAKLETVPEGVRIHYVMQPAGRYGTAITVKLVVDEYKLNEQVVFANGDDFFWSAPGGSQVRDLLAHVKSKDEAAVTGLRCSKEDISARFSEVRVGKNGMVTGIVEKPPIETVTSELANINRYVLSPKLLEFICKYVDSHEFGAMDQEYYLTDPVDEYVKAGHKLRAVPSVGEFLDCGNVEGWLRANNVVCG
jgi:UTP-glucose-1-phosphate uridylyltransferase